MLQELYVINESGQLEMNFDALELVTDDSFVYFIKKDIEQGSQVFKFNDLSTCYEVYTISRYNSMVTVHNFHKNTSEYSVSFFSRSDIQDMFSAIGGLSR